MIESRIHRFRTFEDVRLTLEHQITEMEKKIEEYSLIIGEKLRLEKDIDDPELAEFKEKLERNDSKDDKEKKKKKKISKKKNQKTHWLELGAVSVYDCTGTKGELEIYCNALEELKSAIENLKKVKVSIDDLLSRGLKKDLGCIALMNNNLPLELACIKSDSAMPKKFSYRASIQINSEPPQSVAL